jgi:hypothetical protein
MAKMTREEKAAQAQAERRAKRVAEFKARVEKLRARRVFSREAAWAAQEAGDMSGWALEEMTREFERAREDVGKGAERLERELREARERMARGERPNWSSTLVGQRGSDLDEAVVKFNVLADCVRRLAWATNWRVPAVLMNEQERAKEALVAGLDVVLVEARNLWRIVRDGVAVTRGDVKVELEDSGLFNEPLEFETEEAAWLTAMTLAGEREDW